MTQKPFHNLISGIMITHPILRQFAWLMAGMLGFVVPLIITWLSGWERVPAAWVVSGIGVVFLLAGLWVPGWLRPVYIAWMLFALALGTVMTRVIIAMVFYLMITPIGWIRRTFGNEDPLGRQTVTGTESYWMERKESPPRDQIRKQY